MENNNFLKEDANIWYKNNIEILEKKDSDEDNILNSIKINKIIPKKVLEIGCSYGYRLQWLYNEYNSDCYGIDPSNEAISNGELSFKNLKLQVGEAKELPFDNYFFDLVIFGFCLYLCNRKDLFKIISEADRVLSNKGCIVIEDFYPPFPYKNKYKHKDNVFSYKMNYSKLLTSNPIYNQIYQMVKNHNGEFDISNPDERISITILKKNEENAFPDNPYFIDHT